MEPTLRLRLDRIKPLLYLRRMAFVVADPQVPDWAISAIQGSPAACAILVVGWWIRAAVNKHMPNLATAVRGLAMAIHASTVNESGVRDVQRDRPTTRRPRSPKSEPQTLIPP